MKVICKKDDGLKAECTVKADEASVQDFNVSVSEDGGVMTSWVPVAVGQKLGFDIGCNVTAGEVTFDIIVDGILRSTHTTTSKKSPWEQNRRFTHKFNTASHMYGNKVTDVNLIVKDLTQEDLDLQAQQDDAQDTLGTIEVRIWALLDEKQERQTQSYPTFESRHNWREGDATPTYASVQPTQEIDCVSNEFNPLGNSKITTAHKRMVAARPGAKPWASFKFYYRTQEAINHAGLIKAPQQIKKHMLRWTPPAVKLVSSSEDKAQDQAATDAQDPPEVTQPDLGSLIVPDLSIAQATGTTKDNPLPSSALPPFTDQNTPDPHALGSEKESITPINTINEIDIANTQDDLNMPPKRKGNRSSTAEPVAEPKSGALIVQDATTIPDRENAIKEYEAKNDMKDNAQKTEEVATVDPDLESPDSATVFKKEGSILASVEEVALSSPVTPSPLPLTAASLDTTAMRKRKAASMTPESAAKKACNKLEAEVAAMRKKIAERNAVKIAALKKQEDADALKQAQLERTMAALQEELEDIDEVIAGAEMGYEDTMSSMAASQREDSVVAE